MGPLGPAQLRCSGVQSGLGPESLLDAGLRGVGQWPPKRVVHLEPQHVTFTGKRVFAGS